MTMTIDAQVRHLACLLGMTASLLATGCGDDGPELHPVSGTVTLEGKPLANAGVMFFPRGTTRGNTCVAMTDADGKYTLKPENRSGEGAPEGTFAVTISKMKDPPAAAGDQPAAAETGLEETLSPKYWDSAQSILQATVAPGPNTIDFEL
ncbi:MAG: hypothetical protein AB7O38_17870, partial [Pirellulaceae bacterium]